MKVNRFELVLAYLFIGFVTGFDVAWILMKIPRVDMAMNTGIFIPVSLILGLTAGVVRTYTNPPRAASLFFALVFVSLALYALVSMSTNLKAVWTVGPILIGEGLNLRSLSIPTVRLGSLAFLALGALSSLLYFGSSSRKK